MFGAVIQWHKAMRAAWLAGSLQLLLLGSSVQSETEFDVGAIRGTIYENLAPMPALPVRLHTVVGSMVAETVSDSIGEYHFPSLENAYYIVSVDPPAGYSVQRQFVAQEVEGQTHIVNFYLTHCCGLYCAGFTGNADCSRDGRRNLTDIVRLIDRAFLSKSALCCEANGNIDGDLEELVNLSDITHLIDKVFITKLETASCK